jgi:hypothetical protein
MVSATRGSAYRYMQKQKAPLLEVKVLHFQFRSGSSAGRGASSTYCLLSTGFCEQTYSTFTLRTRSEHIQNAKMLKNSAGPWTGWIVSPHDGIVTSKAAWAVMPQCCLPCLEQCYTYMCWKGTAAFYDTVKSTVFVGTTALVGYIPPNKRRWPWIKSPGSLDSCALTVLRGMRRKWIELCTKRMEQWLQGLPGRPSHVPISSVSNSDFVKHRKCWNLAC